MGLKTLKLILGILSIVLSAMVLLQSCAAGVANSLAENGEVGGSGGFLVAVALLAGGIVMLATRKAEKRGGSIACLILYGLAALIGIASAGSYGDLYIWSGLCAVLAVVNLIALLTKKPGAPQDPNDTNA